MTPTLTTLPDILSTGAERFPDRIALQPASQGAKHFDSHPEMRAFTYRELWSRVRRGARSLHARGLEPGDRVLLAAPSAPDWIVAFFSILEADLVAVPIPDGVGAPLVAAVAMHTRARLCITGMNQLAQAPQRVADPHSVFRSPTFASAARQARPSCLAASGEREGAGTRYADLPHTQALGHVPCATVSELLTEVDSGFDPSGEVARGTPERFPDQRCAFRRPTFASAARQAQSSCLAASGEREGAGTRYADLESALESPRNAGDRLALLAFTSGSTSRPRAVEHTHANIIANLRALLAARQSTEPETMLSMLPPAHLFELVVGQLAPLAIGGRIVYADALLPNRLVTAMREHDVTRVLVVPALLEAICRDVLGSLIDRGIVRPMCQHASAVSIALKLRQFPPVERDRIARAVRNHIGENFRAVGLGGAAIGPGWAETLALLGIGMDVGYGLTEAGPLVSLGWASESPPGSVGRPLPGVNVRIDAGGEILVQSAGVMRGYFADAAATSTALAGGWLRTGDRGHLDADGFLYIAGRLKEVMVTSAGDTLHPEEIEPYYASRAFAEHCVVPLPGPDGNDTPALVVVPRERDISDELLDEEFRDLLRAAPARYRVSTMVRRDAALPRTLMGKLKRRELGDSIATVLQDRRSAVATVTSVGHD